MQSAAVDNYLFDLPEPQKMVMESLRAIIFDTVKDVNESIKWNIPMYSQKGLFLCYLNFNKKYKQVSLGMVEGFLIEDRYHMFIHDTSNVKKILFDVNTDIPIRKIQYYLRAGVRVNQTKTKNFMNIQKRRKGYQPAVIATN